MAFLTYTDLITQVPLWLARSTDSNVLNSVADWVTLCEDRIAYGRGNNTPFASQALRIRAMETITPIVVQPVAQTTAVGGSANAIVATMQAAVATYTTGLTVQFQPTVNNTGSTTLTLTSSAGTLSATPVLMPTSLAQLVANQLVAGATYNFYFDGTQFILMDGTANAPLPAGYLAGREFYVDISPRIALEYRSPDQMNRRYDPLETGIPFSYTIEGDCIRLGPQPDTTYYLWMNYYQKFPTLATASTNWLLTNSPSVYLYGTLIESAPFIGHDERLTLWYSMFRSAVDGLQEQDTIDRHSGALMTMRPQHGCP